LGAEAVRPANRIRDQRARITAHPPHGRRAASGKRALAALKRRRCRRRRGRHRRGGRRRRRGGLRRGGSCAGGERGDRRRCRRPRWRRRDGRVPGAAPRAGLLPAVSHGSTAEERLSAIGRAGRGADGVEAHRSGRVLAALAKAAARAGGRTSRSGAPGEHRREKHNESEPGLTANLHRNLLPEVGYVLHSCNGSCSIDMFSMSRQEVRCARHRLSPPDDTC
jgi:hypothetical protein